MQLKKIINDRQRARKIYGFVQRLPDNVFLAAESDATMAILDWKESVQFASTGSVTLPPASATQAIDGGWNILSNGDRILLKNQSTSSENGIYIVNTSTNTWSRTDDAIPGSSLTCGATTYVEGGTANEGSKWLLSTKNVSLGGAQTWILFDRGNDWIVKDGGGEMKTVDPVAIGGDFPSQIAPDIYFYVSGSRIVGAPSLESTNITLFDGDVTISGTLNMTTSDGFWGDTLEVSGSVIITEGSLFLQKEGTNDYNFFVNSENGDLYLSGSAYHTGSLAQGYGSQCLAIATTANGLFSKAQRFGEYSQSSSGFEANYTNNPLGKAQYSRSVWCGEAASGESELHFKSYDETGSLSQFFSLEDNKSYAVRATAVIADTGDQTDSSVFVRECLFHKSSGVVTRTSINSTLSLPNALTYDLDIVVDGPTMPYNSHISFVVDAVTPATFNTVGNLKGTITIELTEIEIT